MHAQSGCDFPQTLAAGSEEPPQRPAPAQLSPAGPTGGSPLLPSRSKIPDSSREIVVLPSRKSRLASSWDRNLGMLIQNERAVLLWHLDTLRARLGDLGLDWNDGGSSPAVERR